MKREKRNCWKILFLMTAMLTLLLAAGMTTQAASQKTKAMRAYKKMMAKTSIYKEDWKMKTANCEFAVAYIDNNSVPELIVYNDTDIPHVGGYGMLYTYRGGKVRYVTGLTMDDKSSLGYYKKKGILTDAYAQMGMKGEKYIRLKKAKVSSVLYKSYMMNGYSWKLDTCYKYASNRTVEISKKSFSKKLKSYIGSRKMTKFKFYANTAANRAKYLT